MPPLLSDYVRRRRFQIVAPHLSGDVLDLGCGHAGITTFLHPGQKYVGVEGHERIYQWLLENHPRYHFYRWNLDEDTLDLDTKFDTILMLAIVEHLAYPDRVFVQIPSLLKPEGTLLITTPSPGGGVLHRLGARLGLFYREAVDEHETIFSHDTLQPHLDSSGLEIVTYKKFLFGGNQLFICRRKT